MFSERFCLVDNFLTRNGTVDVKTFGCSEKDKDQMNLSAYEIKDAATILYLEENLSQLFDDSDIIFRFSRDNKTKFYYVPDSDSSYTFEDDFVNVVNDIMKIFYYDVNFKIGDLVHCLPFDKIYRNDGYFPYDGEKFVPLDREDYMYGELPERIWPFFVIKGDRWLNPIDEEDDGKDGDKGKDSGNDDGDREEDDDDSNINERSWGMWGPWSKAYLKTLSEGNNRRIYETSYGFATGMIEKTQNHKIHCQ